MPLTEIYAKMFVAFDEDPKVVALAQYGDDAGLARDLYLAMVRYCRRNLSDGLVPKHELMRLAFPLALPSAQRIVSYLVTEELVSEVATGWLVNAYVKRNGTRVEAEARSVAGRDNAHRRWKNADRNADRNPIGNAHGNPNPNAKERDRVPPTPRTDPMPSGSAARRPASPRAGRATPRSASEIVAESRRPGGPASDEQRAARAAEARRALGVQEPERDPEADQRAEAQRVAGVRMALDEAAALHPEPEAEPPADVDAELPDW
jgi:hypothetical protein